MSAPEASTTVNIRQFIKSLEPDEMGKFEPVSGLMLVNMPHAEFMEAFARFAANASTVEDRTLIGTINHETFHAVQAGASGYGFDRQRRLFALLNKYEAPLDPADDPEIKSFSEMMLTAAGDDPELKLRAQRAIAVVVSQRAIEMLESRAAPGDNSVFGALHPGFFRYQTELAEREAARNADGLSIQGLLEGSAVAFAHQLMHPDGGALEAMQAELATLPPLYQELYTLTAARVSDRALELLLPAVALALCYTEPHNAYGEMLLALAASQPGEALAYGRKVMANLPAVPAGGAILGTSVQLRHGDDSYRIYDKFIQNLEAEQWGVDAYAALAEPAALNKVGLLPFAIVTNDNVQAGQQSMTAGELVARMAIMAMVLRVAGRRREELDVRNLQVQWARDVIGRLVDGMPSPTSPPHPDQAGDDQEKARRFRHGDLEKPLAQNLSGMHEN